MTERFDWDGFGGMDKTLYGIEWNDQDTGKQYHLLRALLDLHERVKWNGAAVEVLRNDLRVYAASIVELQKQFLDLHERVKALEAGPCRRCNGTETIVVMVNDEYAKTVICPLCNGTGRAGP